MTNYFYAKDLRDKNKMEKIPRCPGYYKWWATLEDLKKLLDKLEVDEKTAMPYIETKEFSNETRYCIYVGIEKSLYARLKWHITQVNNEHNVKNGTISTLRLSIVSLFGKSAVDSAATDKFIDGLIVEPFECDTYEDARSKELGFLKGNNLYILNIRDNKHKLAPTAKLKSYRKAAKQSIGQ